MADKKPLSKNEIVDFMAKEAGVPKVAAKKALDAFVELACREVKGGRPFRVSGLGTFDLKKTKQRKGVNPATGEEIKIKAKKRMAFRAGAQVKEMLNPTKK